MDMIKVAQRIRTLRLKQKLTVEQLAVKSGFSKAFISRLENFRVNPSIQSMDKVAVALGVKIRDLFVADDQSPDFIFGCLDDGEPIERDEGRRFGIAYAALAYQKTDRRLNPFLIEYTPSDQVREFLRHGNDEFFIMLEGEVDFYVGDDSCCRRMTPGNTVYLAGNLPHKVCLGDGCIYARAVSIYSE